MLDLRNNPGGVLEAGVAVADAFLDRGVIVSADGRTPDARFHMDATPGDLLDGAPMVVLVNGGSASAAEIVAGALKDHARAELIGHRTYGKGSVQTVMPLSQRGAEAHHFALLHALGLLDPRPGILPDLVVDGKDQDPAELSSGDSRAARSTAIPRCVSRCTPSSTGRTGLTTARCWPPSPRALIRR